MVKYSNLIREVEELENQGKTIITALNIVAVNHNLDDDQIDILMEGLGV